LAKAGMPPEVLGIVAYPVQSPADGLRLREHDPMAPGSSMKLVTAAVALDRLGPDSRGRTELLLGQPAVDGVTPGPLILRGGADSDLDWGALSTLLRELREQGVREIRGGLIVDRSLFTPARLDLGVPPFDEAPEFDYNVIPDALHFNGSLLDFELRSGASGPPQVRAVPGLGLQLDASAMTLNDAPCKDWDNSWQLPDVQAAAGGSWRIQLRGAFPRACLRRESLNLIDRQWLTSAAVRQLWAELGGSLLGADSEAPTPPGAVLVATHRSRPLGEVLRGVMKTSDNALSRLIYLRLGAQGAQPGEPTRPRAEAAVREWFRSHQIPDDGLVLDNGSGLSRSERIQPAQMAALLQTALAGRWGPDLLASLPVAGVDGTLSRRLKSGPAAGRARLKTGTLRDAVALAGVVRDARDRDWIFVALLNHPDATAQGRPVLDALVEWVAAQR
jgi:D-alanyl-D-alanine carboxypeptidase/D-alanyl-D-alanine-endopeptidase (penicillin-binding protein 4)